ncbi:E3 ubiquitin-protein ligase TRIM63-like isoform X4 [Phycodurus eques]|uniref:E3 ubiquitin-protein ligase TRIM63-like isoform X4 n=1 Tax=Phycodurus eques TaxID=693459 RepID=UPI002ACEC799|nr:E3 ubiquitin-protein ligase TRIM63-like isoform X4 [Phycodurus eques]
MPPVTFDKYGHVGMLACACVSKNRLKCDTLFFSLDRSTVCLCGPPAAQRPRVRGVPVSAVSRSPRCSGPPCCVVVMESLEKQLICPICLEMFSKPVVILPCQHNLCRKCANDVFQAANPYLSSRGGSTAPCGGRFRCPSCRHEVLLDRHGVYGLQRNLLVENIIDMYKQGSGSKATSLPDVGAEHPVCEHHEKEKINIYCLSCGVPTCSLCKVFGVHKDCHVALLDVTFAKQKAELSECISLLVVANERIQAVTSQLHDARRAVDDNGRRQKSKVCESFDHLFAVLEERKGELNARIGAEQQEKLDYLAGLRRKYGQHLENAAKLLENAIHAMDRAEMAAFLQDSKPLLQKMAAGSDTSKLEKVQLGYEKMEHFSGNFERQKRALMAVNFVKMVDANDANEDDTSVEVSGSEVSGATPAPSANHPPAFLSYLEAPPPLTVHTKTPPPENRAPPPPTPTNANSAPQAASEQVADDDDANKHVFSFSWLNHK